MSDHLKRKHPPALKEVKDISLGKAMRDSRDETVRGSVPIFSLKNHKERRTFLNLVCTSPPHQSSKRPLSPGVSLRPHGVHNEGEEEQEPGLGHHVSHHLGL